MEHLEAEHALDAERMEKWRAERLARDNERVPPRRQDFATLSGIPIQDVYSPVDVDGIDPVGDIGLPGEYPYTRGPHASMYRNRPWTIRQVAGFGQAEDTNGRYNHNKRSSNWIVWVMAFFAFFILWIIGNNIFNNWYKANTPAADAPMGVMEYIAPQVAEAAVVESKQDGLVEIFHCFPPCEVA